ncbi:MAG: CHAT domain-containing protein, partial [Waterburya sp.]
HLPVQSQESNGLRLALEAQQLYQAGKLSQAAMTWQQAATAYQEAGDRTKSSNSLINQAQVLQDLGLYPKACNSLLKAFEVENPECNVQQIEALITDLKLRQSRLTSTQAIGLRSLGEVLRRRGRLNQAQRVLQISKSATQDSAELAATLLALGNVEQGLGNQTRDRWNYDKITEIIDRQDAQIALEPYLEAFVAYEQVAVNQRALPITQIQAQLNYLSLLITIENWWQQQTTRRMKSWQRLEETESITAATNFSAVLKTRLEKTQNSLIPGIEAHLQQLTPSHQGIFAQINYSKSLNKLGETNNIEAILQQALQQAQTIKDQLGESYVLGYLAQYYGQQGKIEQAIALTDEALRLAEAENVNTDVREITYLWQAQMGQLLEQQGNKPEAIAAYTAAFNTLQSLRTDLNANNQVVQFDFLQEVKPVYLRLANLLLQTDDQPQASKSLTSTNPSSNPNLELARQVIESLQLAELDNFFQDPCLETAENTVTIDDLDPQAAVIYPIVLSDRLEVILSVPGKPLQKFTTAVPETTVNETLDLLYDTLYNQSINNSAVNIFSTIPLNPKEIEANINTIVPILQQVYGWLIKPLATELKSQQIQTLVFVLNGRLQNVPMAALYDGQQYLLEQYSIALAPSLQLIDTQFLPRNQVKVLAAGLSQQVEIQGEIFPALINVPEELQQIKSIFPKSQELLNQEFTATSIEQQLQSGFPVIHLATHAVFSSDPQKTFIVAGDRSIININTFNNLLRSSNTTKPELIVLSACDTATGDERAILGLAGVAVRSGSSTLASLWSVGDASTAQLMSQFYREFDQPGVKKAQALQKAQLSLIKSLRTNSPLLELQELPPHPYYWAAYVLVGNWQ